MIASAALYAGILIALTGAACLVRPLSFLHVRSRRAGAAVGLAGFALAAGTAFLPGRLLRSATAGRPGSGLIDELMPDYHFHEVHSRHVEASAERLYAAVQQVRPGEIRFFLLLIGIRTLSARRLFGGGPPLSSQRPLLEVSKGG